MKARQHYSIFLLVVATLLSIVTTTLVSVFTTHYAEIVCQAVEKKQTNEPQKPQFTQFTAFNIQITVNNSKLPTINTHHVAKRTTQQSTLNSILTQANICVHRTLRELRYTSILSYSHQPPLYYIFALHRMRN